VAAIQLLDVSRQQDRCVTFVAGRDLNPRISAYETGPTSLATRSDAGGKSETRNPQLKAGGLANFATAPMRLIPGGLEPHLLVRTRCSTR